MSSVILAAICGLAITPFFRWGIPSGHDFEFHMYSWMDVLAQWKQGILYPRWAALAHWGYGEARFLFYPPGSWTLGAALGAILPWKVVPGAYCWIVLTAAGMSMRTLARQWLQASDALFAGAFYAVNPYHLLIVYWRSAYAELLAAVLVPLCILCLLRLSEGRRRSILWLSLALAGAWLANVPAAMMIHYSVAGLAMLLAWQQRSPRILIKTTLAILLGAGLASFYLVPALYEQGWIKIAEVLSPGVRPQDNFLFTTIPDPDHNRFNLLVSLVASSAITVMVVAAWFARGKSDEDHQKDTDRFGEERLNPLPWVVLAFWGAATAVLMLSVSNFLWKYLPEFRFVQLPFRWLLCLNAPLAIMLAMATRQSRSRSAVRSWFTRAIVAAILLATLLIAGHRIQPPWWDQSADIEEMADSVSDGSGYEGTDEYVPANADPYELKKDWPQVSNENGTPADVRIIAWNATEKHFAAHSASAETLIVRLFNYPAWRITVGGELTQARTLEVTGLIMVPVNAGENDVRIIFARTSDRLAGDIAWLISLIVLIAAWIKTQSPNGKTGAA